MRPVFLATLLLAACTKEAPVQEPAMQQMLAQLRTAIAHFHDDNGRNPETLEELVPRYLAKVPEDPVTHSAKTWRLTMEETVLPSSDFQRPAAEGGGAPLKQILEIHSGAPGADSTGKRWADY